MMAVCAEPDCPVLVERRGRCDEHTAARRKVIDSRRPTAAKRGYGYRWSTIRARFLRKHPVCMLCGADATVADHWPTMRAKLVLQGVPDPDAESRLRALCRDCHTDATRAEGGNWT